MPFPFPTADTRFRLTFIVDDSIVFTVEKNADGPNHALERAIRHLERERHEIGLAPYDKLGLMEITVIETNTRPS